MFICTLSAIILWKLLTSFALTLLRKHSHIYAELQKIRTFIGKIISAYSIILLLINCSVTRCSHFPDLQWLQIEYLRNDWSFVGCTGKLICQKAVHVGLRRVSLSTTHTGWPKNLAQFFLYALTLPNINRFSKLFHCQNQEKICNNTVVKDPTTPQMCRYTTLWNVSS